jgi:hypothetical protein
MTEHFTLSRVIDKWTLNLKGQWKPGFIVIKW